MGLPWSRDNPKLRRLKLTVNLKARWSAEYVLEDAQPDHGMDVRRKYSRALREIPGRSTVH